ncbi:MAG: hypothetical protein KC910_08120 [Candidatus Eremiobacteraeota bacterium]|nr:hypothetical protein [Candidatus Eremiobacteraeota bacterium]
MADYLSGIGDRRPRRWEELLEAQGLAIAPPPIPPSQARLPQDVAQLSPEARRPKSPPSAHAMAVVEALSQTQTQPRLDPKQNHMAWGSRVQPNNWPKSPAARDLPTALAPGQNRQHPGLGQAFDPGGEKAGTGNGAQGGQSAQN